MTSSCSARRQNLFNRSRALVVNATASSRLKSPTPTSGLLLSLMISFLLLLLAAESTGSRYTESDVGECRSAFGVKFQERQRPKPAFSLSLCSRYRHSTCCEQGHTDNLLRRLRLYDVAGYSPKCRDLTEKLTCMPCHPGVGVGEVKGVCADLCEEWFLSCGHEFYSVGSDTGPAPCLENSLICSPLRDFVANGREMCERFGLPIDPDTSRCFNGKAPTLLPGRGAHGGSTSHSDAARAPTDSGANSWDHALDENARLYIGALSGLGVALLLPPIFRRLMRPREDCDDDFEGIVE